MTESFTEAMYKLSQLDRHQLLALLLREGIKGPRDPSKPINKDCPLAKLMQKYTGKDIRVGLHSAWDEDYGSISRTLPVGMLDFRAMFDHTDFGRKELDYDQDF